MGQGRTYGEELLSESVVVVEREPQDEILKESGRVLLFGAVLEEELDRVVELCKGPKSARLLRFRCEERS